MKQRKKAMQNNPAQPTAAPTRRAPATHKAKDLKGGKRTPSGRTVRSDKGVKRGPLGVLLPQGAGSRQTVGRAQAQERTHGAKKAQRRILEPLTRGNLSSGQIREAMDTVKQRHESQRTGYGKRFQNPLHNGDVSTVQYIHARIRQMHARKVPHEQMTAALMREGCPKNLVDAFMQVYARDLTIPDVWAHESDVPRYGAVPKALPHEAGFPAYAESFVKKQHGHEFLFDIQVEFWATQTMREVITGGNEGERYHIIKQVLAARNLQFVPQHIRDNHDLLTKMGDEKLHLEALRLELRRLVDGAAREARNIEAAQRLSDKALRIAYDSAVADKAALHQLVSIQNEQLAELRGLLFPDNPAGTVTHRQMVERLQLIIANLNANDDTRTPFDDLFGIKSGNPMGKTAHPTFHGFTLGQATGKSDANVDELRDVLKQYTYRIDVDPRTL